jgi:hypothetical protein
MRLNLLQASAARFRAHGFVAKLVKALHAFLRGGGRASGFNNDGGAGILALFHALGGVGDQMSGGEVMAGNAVQSAILSFKGHHPSAVVTLSNMEFGHAIGIKKPQEDSGSCLNHWILQ